MDWIPAISTTSLLVACLWLARRLITTRLKESVKSEFETKLENIRSENRQLEERLRSSLQERGAQIDALRKGALSSISERQAALYRRRLEAVDELWVSVTTLRSAKFLASTLASLKVDKVAEMAKRDAKVREFVDTIGFGFDAKNLDTAAAAKAQPFVTPMVWAICSAFQAVIMHAVLQWHALKSGLKPAEFVDEVGISNLLKVALPQYAAYVDAHGASGFYFLFDALEAQLLQEIGKMLEGAEIDKTSVERAEAIVKHSSEVMKNAAAASANA